MLEYAAKGWMAIAHFGKSQSLSNQNKMMNRQMKILKKILHQMIKIPKQKKLKKMMDQQEH